MLLNTPGNSNHLKYNYGSSWKFFQKTILSHQKLTSRALFDRRNCLNHTDLKLSISNGCLVFPLKLLKSFMCLLNKRTARLKPTKQGEEGKNAKSWPLKRNLYGKISINAQQIKAIWHKNKCISSLTIWSQVKWLFLMIPTCSGKVKLYSDTLVKNKKDSC